MTLRHPLELAALDLLADFEHRTSPEPFTAARLRRALDQSGGLSPAVRARLLSCLAQTQRFQAPDIARRLSEECLDLARSVDDTEVLLEALSTATKTYWSPLHLDRLNEVATELVELARTRELLADLAFGLNALLFVSTVQGRPSQRRTRLTQLRAVCSMTNDALPASYLAQSEAQLALASGDTAELERLTPLVPELALKSDDDIALQSSMAFSLFREWTLSTKGPGHETAVLKAETDPWLVAWNIALLSMACEPGNEADVIAGLRAVVNPDLEDLERHFLWLGQTVLIADIARFAGDSRLGAVCHQKLWPHRDLFAPLSSALCVGSTWFGLAAASAAEGDIERAVAEYDRAIDANAGVGYRLWATASKGRKAELMYRHGLPGAGRLVAEATRAARDVKLWPMVRTLEALRDVVPPSPLSRREQEVVEQLSAGKTNKELAESLFISVKTVERHLANVSSKLGVSSRLEVALWAADHRPVQPNQLV